MIIEAILGNTTRTDKEVDGLCGGMDKLKSCLYEQLLESLESNGSEREHLFKNIQAGNFPKIQSLLKEDFTKEWMAPLYNSFIRNIMTDLRQKKFDAFSTIVSFFPPDRQKNCYLVFIDFLNGMAQKADTQFFEESTKLISETLSSHWQVDKNDFASIIFHNLIGHLIEQDGNLDILQQITKSLPDSAKSKISEEMLKLLLEKIKREDFSPLLRWLEFLKKPEFPKELFQPGQWRMLCTASIRAGNISSLREDFPKEIMEKMQPEEEAVSREEYMRVKKESLQQSTNMLKQIQEQNNAMNGNMHNMSQEIAGTASNVRRMQEKIDAMNARMDTMNVRMDAMNTRMDAMNSAIQIISHRVEAPLEGTALSPYNG